MLNVLKEINFSYMINHSLYFGLSLTFAVISIWIKSVISKDFRITKNKLTLRPYFYMFCFFLACIVMDFGLIFKNGKSEFKKISVAYLCLVVYFLRLLFVFLAFGT